MRAEFTDRKDEIAAICRRYRAWRHEAIGSAATDVDSEKSDAGFLVEFRPPLLPGISGSRHGLPEDLRAASRRKFDPMGTVAIRNRCMREAIGSERKLVYASKIPSVGSRAPCIEEAGK
ncbi:MAG: hypothetical protein OYG32_04975 [Rhodospirillaceae bacterium]|nr:hypothetical protein [Rhodospirillaceae bacterium]